MGLDRPRCHVEKLGDVIDGSVVVVAKGNTLTLTHRQLQQRASQFEIRKLRALVPVFCSMVAGVPPLELASAQL